jgi:SAM-dependent methyltransferase
MHPRIFEEFDAICAPLSITGEVLEIGASRDHPLLLALPALGSAAKRIGVGLGPAFRGDDFEVLSCDANDLGCFASGRFQLVLCNAMLEHDARFWLTLAEARRVSQPGGWMVLGVPSYGAMDSIPGRHVVDRLSRLPLIGRRWRDARAAMVASAPTLGLHHFPSDYYRFSEHAMAEVLLEGLEQKQVRLLLNPPRVIGIGQKPARKGRE